MTEYSRPFQLPDVGGVAVGYNEAQTREYFNWIMKQNGIRRSSATWATGDLAVYASTPTAMTVEVAVGGVFINGGAHDSTAVVTKTIDAAHATLDRTDSIVARLSVAAPDSSINIAVLKGDDAAAGTSVAKALTQNSTTWELRLATVLVSAAVTDISGNADTLITDTRLTSECGIAAPQMGFFSLDASGNLQAGSKYITGLADPVSNQDADTKAARDAAIAALSTLPDPSGNAGKTIKVKSDGTGYEIATRFPSYTSAASNNLKLSDDAEVTTTTVASAATIPIKGISIPPFIVDSTSAVRIKFDVHRASGGGGARYALYKNGVKGLDSSSTDDAYITITQDLTCRGGDVITLYGAVDSSSGTAYYRNFRIYCDLTEATGSTW